VDTTCYLEDNNYCVGACIKDNNGRFVQAFAKKLQGTSSIAEAEALGVLEVLRWTHNTSYGVIQIETDCLQVVHGLNNKRRNDTEFGSIIEECRRLLVLNLNYKVSHIQRQANRVAYELAQSTHFTASVN
jgi:ribonuclease HI